MEHFIDMMRYWQWNYLQLLEFILAISTIVMVLVQLINIVTPIRAAYHAYLLRRWISERARLYEKAEDGKTSHTVNTDAALSQLIAHATGGHARALLGLPAQQLVAQINAAAQGALDNIKANYSLIAVLSQPADPQIPLVLKPGRGAERVSSHIDDLSTLMQWSPAPAPRYEPPRDDSYEMKSYLEARTRVVHRIQRNLDGMQITLGNDSDLANQILSILISTAICCIIVLKTRSTGHSYVLTVLLLGAVTGFIAPLLGDIATAIRRLGRP